MAGLAPAAELLRDAFVDRLLRLDDGDGVGAARALHAALRAAPGSARAREMLGRLLLEAAEMEQAVALLSSALDLDPSNGEPRWDLVRAHALTGDMASAEALLALPVDTEAGRLMRAYVGARVALWQPRDRARAPAWQGPPGSGLVWGVVLLHEQVLRTRTLSDADSAFLEEHAAGTRSRAGGGSRSPPRPPPRVSKSTPNTARMPVSTRASTPTSTV